MNKERRKRAGKAIALIEEAQSLLSELSEEEQEALDNMPESLQEGGRGQGMEEAVEALYEAAEELENIAGGLADYAE